MSDLTAVKRTAKQSRQSREKFEAAVRKALESHSIRDVMKAAGFKSPAPIQRIRDKTN